ncbi:MAG: hypothetical protein K2X34_10570 [Hyphomonadaceae bacterium]|nr:hypothetical protein [Hyphomonadaceae bacterium]
MRVWKSIAAIGAMMLCGAQAPLPPRIEYDLTPVMRAGELVAVQVDMRFRGEADGETRLRLPGEWGGQPELWRSLADIAAVSGAALAETGEPNSRVLAHRPNARIHLRYRIIQDFEGAPNARGGNAYRPIIQPSYFHLIGDAVFITPENADLITPVRVRPRNFPRGWRYASDLEHSALTLGRIWSSVTVGGDFRIVERPEQDLRIALRGAWSFGDDAFADEVSRILGAQRAFFSDPPSPYLVTVIQLESPQQNWLSIGGTGLGDAFAFFATANAEASGITGTLAHEGLHTWISGLIGGLPSVADGQAAHYWLSEGFTDFYTGRILVREGIWTPAQFAEHLNEGLRAYAQSPVREAPNSRILADYWTDRDVQRLPYLRGRWLATLWDQRLRAQGRDFDDAILEMRARARAGDPLKAGDMFPVVMEGLGVDVRADIATYVEGGAAILLPEDIFAPCGRVETSNAAAFHRGFDIAATQANNNIITGVDPTHPAYAAGMRDGMVLIRRDSGEIGNAEVEIAYVVRDGETERTLRYMPRSNTTFVQQRLVLSDQLVDNALAQCIAVLGGA